MPMSGWILPSAYKQNSNV